MARVVSLGSGSSGNCFFVGDAESGVLIDAGISFKAIKTALEGFDISLDSISALLITHEHSDHIKGLATFLKKTDIPVVFHDDLPPFVQTIIGIPQIRQ